MNYRKNIVIVVLLLSSFCSFGQEAWKTWDALELTLSQSKKLDHKISYLKCYNITDSFHNDFNQLSYQADYSFNKKISIRGSLMVTSFPSSSDKTLRIILRASYNSKIGNKFNWVNSVQFEYHSNDETRFRERAIFITRFGLKKRLKFLKLSPSVSYWLFYNIGGNDIKYYVPDGSSYTRNLPNGFHRGRLFLNLNSKISKNLSLSLYYMNQKEFNFLCSEDRKINVSNPRTGKIYRPFDNYQVIGLSALVDINLYKKK